MKREGLVIVLSLLSLLSIIYAQPQLNIKVQTSGQFVVHYGDQIWFESAGTGFRSGNLWYASADADINGNHTLLKPTTFTATSGANELGAWRGTEIKWTSARNSSLVLYTQYKQYQDINAIGFEQSYPSGLEITTVDKNNDVSTNFPSFKRHNYGSPKNYLTYHDTFAVSHVGTWDDQSTFNGGVEGGVPFVLYDANNNVVVISPIDNFMISSQTVTSSFGNTLACGVSALVSSLPARFTHETIMYAGNTGVSEVVYQWGSLLLKISGKERTRLDADLFIQYLSYYTDNGAYYYYKTYNNYNYAQTIQAIDSYANASKIPFQLFQFDSWWYFQEKGTGALLLWEPRPDIFPQGMRAVYDAIGQKPLTLHNRYFSDKNDYLGKGFNFIVEDNVHMSLPIDVNLFKYIMGLAKSWGMVVYEQDWLVTTYLTMMATRSSVTASEQWLTAMAEAARELGLTVQYCMPLPNHILQSTKYPAVTQIRANGDYQPGNRNWRVSFKSILLHAVGVTPFKDDFWTSNLEEVGCIYRSCIEPNPDLVSLTAVLTTGPVGPSDKIGFLNTSRILPGVNANGLILKPDVPPRPMNLVFTRPVTNTKLQTSGVELWDTYSIVDDGFAWHYVVAADHPVSNYTFGLGDLFGNFSRAGAKQALAWNWHEYYGNNKTKPIIVRANDKITVPNLTSTKEGEIKFIYWVIAPTFPNGWTFLGEMNKYVTMSRQRFTSVGYNEAGNSVYATFTGKKGEVVSIGVSNPSNSVIAVDCVVGSNFGGAVGCSGSTCRCWVL